jgi:hypothetical protein
LARRIRECKKTTGDLAQRKLQRNQIESGSGERCDNMDAGANAESYPFPLSSRCDAARLDLKEAGTKFKAPRPAVRPLDSDAPL